jgi:hypothetical protein
VPILRAVVTPVELPIDAIDVLLLLHIPPVTPLLMVTDVPIHKLPAGVMAVGDGLTVTVTFALFEQP